MHMCVLRIKSTQKHEKHRSSNWVPTWAYHGKVQVGKDQEKAQSERDSHSKNRGGKTLNTYTTKTYRKPNEQLLS